MKNIFFNFTHIIVVISMLTQSMAYAAPAADTSAQTTKTAVSPEALKDADASLLYAFRTESQKVLVSSEAFLAVAKSLLRDANKKSQELLNIKAALNLDALPNSNIKIHFEQQFQNSSLALEKIAEGLSADISNMEKLLSRGLDFRSVHPELSMIIAQRLMTFDKLQHSILALSQTANEISKIKSLTTMDFQSAKELVTSIQNRTIPEPSQEKKNFLHLSRAEAINLLKNLETQLQTLQKIQAAQGSIPLFSNESITLLQALDLKIKNTRSSVTQKFESQDTLLSLILIQEYISRMLNEASSSTQEIVSQVALDSKFLEKISDALRTSVLDMILSLPSQLISDAKKAFETTANTFNEFIQALYKKSLSESELLTALQNAAQKTFSALKDYFLEVQKTDSLLVERSSPEEIKDFTGKDFWSSIETLARRLRGMGYQPYHENTSDQDSKLIEPLEVQLKTPGLSQVLSITDSDIETLAKKNWFQTYATSTTKNLVVNLKPSSISKTDSKVGTVEVRTEFDPQLQKKKMLLDVTSQDNEKVSFEYVLDPDLAVKTYTPLLREALITREQAKGAVISTIQRFPFEMVPFNAGILVNSWLNLLTRYENDPKAVERVVAEWLSFPGMMSFIGFMMGNQFSSIMMNQVARGKLSKQMVPFLSMGFGALFSNIAGDLLAITKPCADAIMKRDDLNPGDVSRICEEGFHAVVNSDMIHRYIQTSITVSASSTLLGLGTNLLKMGIEKAAQRSLAINGLVGVTSAVVQKLSRWGWHFPKIGASLNPITLGISTLHLVAFFQTDHLINPYIHKAEETLLNSGAELALSNNDIKRALGNLKERGFQNHCDLQKDVDSPVHRRHAMTSDSPGAAFRYADSCEPIPVLMKKYEEASRKWSDTLQYEFNMAFYSWQEFYSEFISQRDIAQKFYASLLNYIHSKNDDTAYNPLFENDPLYGVLPVVANPESAQDAEPTENQNLTTRPEKILIEKTFLQMEDEFFVEDKNVFSGFINKKKYNDARILRLRQAAFIIDEDIKTIQSTIKSGQFINTNTFESYIARLQKIRELILDKGILNEDFSKVEEGLLLVKDTFDSYKNHTTRTLAPKYAAGHPGGMGPLFAIGGSSPVAKSIRDIYNFIGRPKPLKAGQGFMIRFNDWVIANYGLSSQISSQVEEVESTLKNTAQYIDGVLFPNALTDITTRHGDTPAETMLYYAMCGLDLSNPIKNYKKQIEDNISEANGTPIQKNPKLSESRKVLFGLLESGTGVDFVVPKLIDSRVSEPLGKTTNTRHGQHADSICKRGKAYYSESVEAMVPSSMKAGDFDETLGRYAPSATSAIRQQFKNSLDFVVNAVSSQIYNRESLEFATWWDKNINPATDDVFNFYEDAYFQLIDTKFKETLFGKKDLPKTAEEIESLIEKDQLEKTLKALPNTQAGLWMTQVQTYIASLNVAYAQLQQKEILKLKILSTMNSSEKEKIDFEIQVRNDDIQRFAHNAEALKKHAIFMISDLAVAMTPGASAGTSSRSDGFNLSPIFGPALGYLNNMMEALGLKVDLSAQGLNYYSHLHNILKLESKYEIGPATNAGTALQALVMSNSELANGINAVKERIHTNEEYRAYLGIFSNIILAPQTIENPNMSISAQEKNEIELAYMATTQLFTALNDIFNKTTIFKAASSKNTFQEFNLEQLERQRKGTAGSMNR